VPTRENVAQFESLLDATTALIETKRLIDKADYDIKVLRNRLELREKSQSVDGETKTESNDAIGVDYTQGDGDGDIEEGDDGRGQSVVSTKSGRNRKHVSDPSNLIWPEALNSSCLLVTALSIHFFGGHHCNCVYKSRHKTSETQLKMIDVPYLYFRIHEDHLLLKVPLNSQPIEQQERFPESSCKAKDKIDGYSNCRQN